MLLIYTDILYIPLCEFGCNQCGFESLTRMIRMHIQSVPSPVPGDH